MRAKLFCKWGPGNGQEFVLENEGTIGRSRDNSIRLDAKRVSKQHARIFFDTERGAYYLEDLGSLNGTELDGVAVTRPERLGRLHVIRFAKESEFMWVELPDRGEAPAGRETQVDQEMPELPEPLKDAAEAASDTAEPDHPSEAGKGTRVEKLDVVLPPNLVNAEESPEDE